MRQTQVPMVQVVVFVPKDFKEAVKQAMFDAGGGMIGNYDSCCFEHEGVGQFRALKGSHAFIGEVDKLEHVVEVRIEMACDEDKIVAVIQAMKRAHPYETPAYYTTKTLEF